MWGAPSDKRTGLSFTNAAGPRQRCHSRVRVPWDSRPDSRLPFSSPPTTRTATVEVLDPASTREFVLKVSVWLCWLGCHTAPTHERDPTTAQHGDFRLPFITAREPNRDHRIQGFHYWFLWMRCLRKRVLIPKQRFGFWVFTNFSFRIHGNRVLQSVGFQDQSLRGNVFARSFPSNGPHVTICSVSHTQLAVSVFWDNN
jgi:hypothetical protein